MNSLIKKIVLASCGVLFLNSCSPLDGLGSNTQTVNTTIAQPSQYGVVTVPQNTNYVAPTVANVSGKYVALTFDDGPVAANTTRLMNILKARNIKATFYVLGSRVKRNPSLMKRMVAEGHEVGNHTWTHGKLTAMSDTAVRSELDRTRDAIVAATGIKPRTMRPPYGALSTRQRNWIFKEYGYPTILWDVDPQDWKKPGTGVIKSRIVNGSRSGSIILLHDLHSSSVDAVPSTVDALLRQGYKFVTVSQLIALSK